MAVTGQVSSKAIGTDAFQEAHILGITLPIVKHSLQVRSTDEIPQAVKDAFYIASTGRPGPVLIDVPVDVQKAQGDYMEPGKVSFPGYRPDAYEDLSNLDEAVGLIRKAERPMIVAGNGINISRAFGAISAFANELSIPVANSLLGKGTFPESNPLSIGMMGMHGCPVANRALTKADLIIAVGSRFSDRSTGRHDSFATKARIIHLDMDPAEIDKSVGAHVWLLGDAEKLLDTLRKELGGAVPAGRAAWLSWLEEMNAKEPLARSAANGVIKPWQIMEAIHTVTKGEAMISTEVGQHQMWAAQYFKADHPRRFITSGGLGTMGFGLPAAMGAYYARPEIPNFCIAGDGSVMMNIQELDTMARYKIPVKTVVMDNNCLGMVRQWQELFYEERFSSTLYSCTPDFVKIAEGMGVRGIRIDEPANLVKSLDEALAIDGPVMIHIPIPKSEMVFPMIPAGAALDDMILA